MKEETITKRSMRGETTHDRRLGNPAVRDQGSRCR